MLHIRLKQNRLAKLTLLFILGFGILACDDEGGGEEKPVIRVGGDEGGEMAGTESGTMAGDMGGSQGGMMGGTQAGMTAGDEMPRIRSIETCEELCGVYEACSAPDAHPWGECLSGCMGEDWEDQRFRSYVSCLKLEPCETIDACRIPPPPLPSCEEACAQLDVCGIDYQFPSALTMNTVCSTACGDTTWARQIPSCVQANERRLCDDNNFFDTCILEARGGECLNICQAQANCDENIDLVDCTVNCLTEAPLDDALSAYRQEQIQNCVVSANDCTAVESCLEPAAEPVSELAEQVCTAANGCGVFADGVCPEIAGRALTELSTEGLNCLLSRFEMDCNADLTECFNQTAPASSTECADYCFVASLCEALPMGQSEFDCVEECQSLADLNEPSAFASYQSQIACSDVNSCQALNTCLSGGGEGDACVDLCIQRVACGEETEEECLSRCASRYATERSRRERSCGALLSCEASEQCQIPPTPNCEDFCSPLEACGAAQADCLTQCDNAELYRPEEHLPRLSCVNASERCDYITSCLEDTSNAQACLTFCAYQQGCTNGTELGEASEECALACARGVLSEEQAGQFIPAANCIGALDPSSASCAEVSSCIEQADSLCEALCQVSNTCALPFVGDLATDCVAACEAGQIPENAQLCVINAEQREAGCGAVATCLGFPIPEPTPACEEYCSALKLCDPSVDLYTCHSQCISDSAGDGVRAVCTSLVECNEIAICQDETAEASVDCLRTCQDLEGSCGIIGEGSLFEDYTACSNQCGGLSLAFGEAVVEELNECATNAECNPEALGECFVGNFAGDTQEICQRSLDAVRQCGLFDFLMVTEDQFFTQCALDYQADRWVRLQRLNASK